jgi:VIT1/CCC1 family predicted Fe2+/Mn2+ transporter
MMDARALDPVSRATEVLFGLIMILTFTASLNTAEAGRSDVRLMLIAALGCNLAWGVIDAAMYLLSTRADAAISRRMLEQARRAPSPAIAHAQIRAALPTVVAAALDGGDLERIRLRLAALPSADDPRLTLADWRAAVAVFLLVFISTLPVALPFLLVEDARRALWLSHCIAITSLFLAGYTLGTHWGRPVRVGLAMVALGAVLVAIALLLGG